MANSSALVLAVAFLLLMVTHSAIAARNMQISTVSKTNPSGNHGAGFTDNKNFVFSGVGAGVGGTAGIVGPFGGASGFGGIGGGIGHVFPVGGVVGGGVGGAGGGVGGIIP